MTPQNEPQEALTPSPETELRAEVERDVENAYPILSRRNLALRANLEAAELDLRATKARAEAAEARVKELEEDRSRLRIARHDYETTLTAETKKREEAEARLLEAESHWHDICYNLREDAHKARHALCECISVLSRFQDDHQARRAVVRGEEVLALTPTNSPITGSKLVVPPEVATVAKSATVPPSVELVDKLAEALKSIINNISCVSCDQNPCATCYRKIKRVEDVLSLHTAYKSSKPVDPMTPEVVEKVVEALRECLDDQINDRVGWDDPIPSDLEVQVKEALALVEKVKGLK